MILGIDWLTQYRPMQVDWNKKWISFSKEGNPVKWQMRWHKFKCVVDRAVKSFWHK